MSPAVNRLESRGRIELEDYPVDAAWSPDARALVVAGGEGAVVLLQPQSGTSQIIGNHPQGALAVSWQPGGALFASAGQDGSVQLWDGHTRVGRQINSANAWVEHLAFAAGGRWLAAAAGRALTIFDANGVVRGSFDKHPGVIAALHWRPKSSEIAAVGNGGAWLHRLEPRAESRAYPCAGAALSASWSPDGRTLAAGQQDGSVQLWFIASGTQSQMKGYGMKVALTGWSANGRFLATAAGEVLVVWAFGGKQAPEPQALELRGHSERIVALAARPTGSWLVSAARDRRLLLWRLGHGEEPADAHLLPAECTTLKWSNDGRWLASGDQTGGVSLFEFVT